MELSSDTRNRKFGRVAAVAEPVASSNDARSASSRVMIGSGGVMTAGDKSGGRDDGDSEMGLGMGRLDGVVNVRQREAGSDQGSRGLAAGDVGEECECGLQVVWLIIVETGNLQHSSDDHLWVERDGRGFEYAANEDGLPADPKPTESGFDCRRGPRNIDRHIHTVALGEVVNHFGSLSGCLAC